MIRVDELKKIVKLCLASSCIKDMKPLSLLIVAKAGSGKTEIITSYKNNSLEFETDLNYSKMVETLMKNSKIKHLIIPDFIKITHKKSSTSKNLISLFNSSIEDGMYRVDGYYSYDFKGRNVGLITSITPGTLGQLKTEWGNIGFLDRMIVCKYEYSEETWGEILKMISKEENDKKVTETINFKIEKTKKPFVVKSDEKFNAQFIPLSGLNARKQKNFQRLAKCNAVVNGRLEVCQEDVDEIIKLSKYMKGGKAVQI